MNDLDIKYNNLDELLNKIEKDNYIISEHIKSINKIIKSLDETKWKSPNKDKMNTQLEPFLNTIDENIDNVLSIPLINLRVASTSYKDTESKVKEKANMLGGNL